MCNTDQPTNHLGLTDKNHVCACQAPTESVATATEGVITEQYLVEGMTCSHCVASVTEEVSALEGVERVSVDLQAGGASRVTVVSDRVVAVDQIRDAVTEAGYTLVAGSQ